MDDSDHIGNSIGPDTEEGLAGPLVALTEVNDDNSNSMNGAKKVIRDRYGFQTNAYPISRCAAIKVLGLPQTCQTGQGSTRARFGFC